jgi:hypothetical protein
LLHLIFFGFVVVVLLLLMNYHSKFRGAVDDLFAW